MQTTTLSYSNIHKHGELFANLFRARKQHFIDRRKWQLPETDGMEFDQYDTPMSRWIAIHDSERVLAGFRLTPTTAVCGSYSYMIRDAQNGILGGSIPENLLDSEAPVDQNTWELTRVFIDHAIPQGGRRRVQMRLVESIIETARELGALHLIALTDATWPRFFSRCGLEAEAAGPRVSIDDGEFQCVMIHLKGKMH